MALLHGLLASFLLLTVATCSSDFIAQFCSKNITAAGDELAVLQSTINNTFVGLLAQIPVSGFAIYSASSTANITVYGLSSCRGDIGSDACSDCINIAAQQTRTSCPNSAQSLIFYGLCLLRYDISNFYGRADNTSVGVWVSTDVAEDPAEFDAAVKTMMVQLMFDTTRTKTSFGRAVSVVNRKTTLHGMAQCTRDLFYDECVQCLNEAWKRMADCKHHLGCYVIDVTCALRYDVNSFLIGPAPEFHYALAPAPA